MAAYKLLAELRKKAHTKKHPAAVASGHFDHVFKVKKPKTAAQLEALIEELINLQGGCMRIIYTGGRNLVNKTKASNVLGHERHIVKNTFIPGTTKPGTADLLGIYKGRGIAVEVKFSAGDRMSVAQVAFKKDWELAGGLHIIAHNLNDILILFKNE